MKLQQLAPKIVFVLVLIVFIIGISAFSQKDNSERNSFRKEAGAADNDTTASRQRDRYLTDKDMDKLDEAMKKLDEQMATLNERMQKINKAEIQQQLHEAMQQVDFEKINRQIKEAMKKADVQKMNAHLNAAMASIDEAKLQAQLEKTQKMLEKEQQNFSLHQAEMKAHIDNAMKHAKESLEKAKQEIQNTRDFTNALQSDGLIDKKKNYKIEVRKGELYIDDKKQSKEVSDKYRKYYKKDNFTITLNDGEGVRI